MGFSLMVLALLARLRVLVQQMLLDVVYVFNEVSSLAQKKQSIKITQDGIEVFREYYPTVEDEIVALECVWKTDKFVLKEISGKGKILHQDRSSETVQTQETSVKYRSIDTFLGDESDSQSSGNEGENSISNAKRKRPESPSPSSDENNEKVQKFSAAEDSLGNSVLQQNEKTSLGGCSLDSSISPPISSSFTNNLMAKKKVAFISVKQTIPVSSEAAISVANEGEGKRHDEENALFSLVAEEEAGGSIF